MVTFNTLWKLCIVVAFWLLATVTSTEVAQEQPKKEPFSSRFFGKNEEPAAESQEILEPENADTKEDSETAGPPRYSVEWYLLPKLENRAQLLEKLPFDVAKDVPRDYDEPIDAALEKRIRKFFSLRGLIFTSMSSYPPKVKDPGYTGSLEHMETSGPPKFSVEWYLLPKPDNRTALRTALPRDIAKDVPEDCDEPINPLVERSIWMHFTLSNVEWLLLPKPENRMSLLEELPTNLSIAVPEDCNEPIDPSVEKDIRNYFSSYLVDWYVLPEPENRTALRKALPSDLVEKVPKDSKKQILPEVEKDIRKFFLLSHQEQEAIRRSKYNGSV
uniref:Small open reading frame n=1 Tax=Babesia bovis TaxID=5865 RepID=S6BER6_BABBO|nr:small open reading frame [Babesia bovis]